MRRESILLTVMKKQEWGPVKNPNFYWPYQILRH
jgi:hypothetical protein